MEGFELSQFELKGYHCSSVVRVTWASWSAAGFLWATGIMFADTHDFVKAPILVNDRPDTDPGFQ